MSETLTTEEYFQELRDNVDRGIEYLNKTEPYWFHKIDLEKLDIDSCMDCVVGQVFGNYIEYFPFGQTQEWGFIGYCDFELEDRGVDTSISIEVAASGVEKLNEIWKEKIKELQCF